VSHGHGPPPEERIRRREARVLDGRDITPAVGRRGGPGTWKRASPGARVRGFRERFADARWSFLYDDAASRYEAESADGQVPAAARVMRGGSEVPVPVRGPVIRPNVWTWEVPVYFFFGGMAAGASFVALACEVAGDERSARIARFTAMGAAGCGGPLLIADLGRPERFHHMFRIFKTRSPMSMGAWCLLAFTQAGGGAVAADLLGRRRVARALTAATAACGVYLGSYTGVLLAGTAVPAWNRSRAFLPPIFVCTATASGAAATRLALAAAGVPRRGAPTRRALAALEAASMAAELVLSALNDRRLGVAGRALESGRSGRLLKTARALNGAGLAVRAARALRPARVPARADDVPSALFLAAAILYRLGWVSAGRPSALDHEAVAALARDPAATEPVGPPPGGADPSRTASPGR
jgi:formate-dependent nitrite reductase membrane component NrfD